MYLYILTHKLPTLINHTVFIFVVVFYMGMHLLVKGHKQIWGPVMVDLWVEN